MRRIEALEVLAELCGRHPVVVTCAATSRELAAVRDGDNHFYLLDAMGLVGSVATGLALGLDPDRPKVVGIEGDGSLLMNPNVLPTGGYLAPANLLLVLLDNGVYGSTGALPTYSSRVDVEALAAAAGWTTRSTDTADGLRTAFADLLDVDEPAFLHVRIEPGNAPDVAKLLLDPVSLRDRFARWLREDHLAAGRNS
ncbi:thiamine pyrophosphate-dependent enzyme [Umezawaea endophytica]|uniref:Thiamine pyrophosphate-dependent enzyme n=1 Tax=Umezawaea endophytica TaxID=1654476 RepID=A0A9X2VI43_9PSEU|nr:thiamine pyrophosphate-dependent enzyme [Umezawaea endophytica]MCS7477140.1 thiamine pyrophosphate-dependent enzyme [Umezawaea endophytica]